LDILINCWGGKENLDTMEKRILVAIPCYNEGHTIGSVILKAKHYADDVLVIDDGSTDDTAKVAEYAGAAVLRHGGNKGYGAAIRSCFEYARENSFDIMTILDGDGQHEAEEILTVMEPILKNGTDISIGSRFVNGNGENVPLYRRFGIGILTRLTNAGSKKNQKVTDGQSGFRAYSRKAIETIYPKDNGMGVSAEILMQGRKKNLVFEEVEINCRYDVDGSTNKPVGHGLGVILSILKYMEVEHSLLFFGVPALILFILGLVFGIKVVLDFNATYVLAVGNALITVMLLVTSILLGITGLILHAVINAARRI
jgi:glycosyltransferase involved in cell wall biosynthesis